MRLFSSEIFFLAMVFLVLLPGQKSSAQISSSSADYQGILYYEEDTVNFPGTPLSDPYFVFNASSPGTDMKGSLTASSPAGDTSSNFAWSIYDSVSKSFAPPFITETGQSTSTVNDLEPGGYSVHITSAGFDTLFRAWVFSNDPHVEVLKDANGKINPYQAPCAYLNMIGRADADTLAYSDLNTGKLLTVPNAMSWNWTTDDPEYEFTASKYTVSFYIYNSPPWSRPPTKDTRFTLTAVDSFNVQRSDEALYESVHVKAGFTMFFEERGDFGDEGVWTESEKPEEEAPLEIRFKNTTENGVEFKWILVDSAKTGQESEFTTYDVNDSVVFTYYTPGYYYPKMIAWGEFCSDSFPVNTRPEIHVIPSELDAPNVFSPNGDGVNDFFVVRAKSLKAFRITIFNRNGGKVYEYEHRDGRLEWEGWDGSINGKGKSFAEPGVYYYIIDALGWDATVYRDIKPYTGFVYLFREAR